MNDALPNMKMQHTLVTLYKTTHTNEVLTILMLIVEPSVCRLNSETIAGEGQETNQE